MKVQIYLILIITCFVQSVLAKEEAPKPESTQEQVIEPDIYRRDVDVPRIDTENFEITAYYGLLDIEDFGSDSTSGVRVAYHITEDFFIEGAYGQSSTSDKTIEDLTTFNVLQDEDVTYYSVSIGYNIFPGEIFLGQGFAMTSSFYLMAGVGNVEFNAEDEFAYNVGFGFKTLPTDWLSLRVDVRDIVFETDLLGTNEFKNNFEITGNIGVFF